MSAATLVQYVTEFAAIAEAEYDETVHGSADETPEVLAIVLAAIRNQRADLAALAKKIEADLLAIAGEKTFVIDGLGEVAIKQSTKRTKWRHDELVAAVLARVMDEPQTIFDPVTGELLPYTQIGANVARRLRECVSFGAGKVTGLRAIGLQPDEFCEEEPEGYSVALPSRAVA